MNRPEREPTETGAFERSHKSVLNSIDMLLAPTFFWGGECRQGDEECRLPADSNPMGVWCDLRVVTTKHEKPGAIQTSDEGAQGPTMIQADVIMGLQDYGEKSTRLTSSRPMGVFSSVI